MAQSAHRFGEFSQRLMDLRGQAEPGLVADYVLPVLVVNDPAAEDARALRGEFIAGAAQSIAALAANYSFVGLHNPEGSGHVFTLDSFFEWGAAISLVVGLLSPSFIASAGWTAASGTAGIRHDSRVYGSGFAVGRMQTFQQAAAVFSIAHATFPGTQAAQHIHMVVHPGWAAGFRSAQLNQGFDLTVQWTEHLASGAELALRR